MLDNSYQLIFTYIIYINIKIKYNIKIHKKCIENFIKYNELKQNIK